MRPAVSIYRVRSLALQPLSAGNSAEFSQANNSKTIQPREVNPHHWIPKGPVNRFMYTTNQKTGRNMN